ncbi:hypothetical protein Vdis_0071 [Vulcanisaeta distributa DSM 14429]|uniref:Uncharacterized protein n=1 Tax=Vulcanisaeta distributa (strain DSM 14429 / JCM 11212 / NBRC 100878 / IC-017) TaxID=572478 RepID=E1QS93_VULDI|nr:hypothetical protein Vdis_0071 [Vulcanisaeta distributa DSM 14429]
MLKLAILLRFNGSLGFLKNNNVNVLISWPGSATSVLELRISQWIGKLINSLRI